MRRAPRVLLVLAAAAAALAGCGGPVLFAELQIPDVRLTVSGQQFPASDTTIPANWCQPSQTNPPCVQLTMDFDVGAQVPILNEPNVTYDLRLKDVGIHLASTDAGKSLAGVKLVSIRILSDPADPTSGAVVASYVRPAAGAAPAAISVAGNSNLGLGPYLRTGRLPFRVEVVIDQPTPAFLADVESGFSVKAQLDYGSLL